MAIDLGTLRETARGHKKDLLVKKSNEPTSDEEILNLMVSNKYANQKEKRKVGRPPKEKNQYLNDRITLILTKEQKEIINQRRCANSLGEIDASSFIREWLIRTKCFDTNVFPINENPTSNLPK